MEWIVWGLSTGAGRDTSNPFLASPWWPHCFLHIAYRIFEKGKGAAATAVAAAAAWLDRPHMDEDKQTLDL